MEGEKMKRLYIFIAIITLITFNAGCTNKNYSNVSTTATTTESQIEIPVSLESDVFEDNEKNTDININDDIVNIDKYEILDVENITFEQYLNGNDTITRPLFPTLFNDNTIYVLSEYYNLAEKKNAQNAISSFDILTKENKELFAYDFHIGYYPDFIYKNHYFTFPCTYNEQGELQINIIDYDKEKEVSQIIYQGTVTSPYFYADYLSDSEAVFLIFPTDEEKTYQRILKYDFKNSRINVLYENEYIYPENENDVSENIWTIDTYNGSIFLLNTQVSNGDRSWNVIELDSTGNILNKTALTGLYDYRAINCSVNQFVVTSNEYLIQYYNPDNNSNFVAVDRDDESISVQFDKLIPCTLISPFWVKDRYLLYDTFPDYGDYDVYSFSSDICIYDSFRNTFYFLKVPLKIGYKIDKIISNERGDVVLVISDDTNIYQYLLVSDIISYIE